MPYIWNGSMSFIIIRFIFFIIFFEESFINQIFISDILCCLNFPAFCLCLWIDFEPDILKIGGLEFLYSSSKILRISGSTSDGVLSGIFLRYLGSNKSPFSDFQFFGIIVYVTKNCFSFPNTVDVHNQCSDIWNMLY